MKRGLFVKILITGVSGLLGNNLALSFRDNSTKLWGQFFHQPVAIADCECFGLDLRDYIATRHAIHRIRPEVVIHCASRTDVDRIEQDKEGGWQSNVMATRVLMDALRDSEAKVVYISTDSVYPGEHGPYLEEGPLAPCNWYGSTKLEGERIVADRPGSLILRTNIFGWNCRDKESIGEWFLNRLARGETVRGFIDARFSTMYTFTLAAILQRCLAKGFSGLYNCASRDACSKFEFGRRLAKGFGFDEELVQPIRLADVGLVAGRGNDLSLDVQKLTKDLGQLLPTMTESLDRFRQDWQEGLPARVKGRKPAAIRPVGGDIVPPRAMIPYGCQVLDEQDIEAVAQALKSSNLTQGPGVVGFEEALARTVGAETAVVVNSGTSALHIACLAVGVGPGDEVITSPITFVASANCVAYCGARPVFADIDPLTYNVSPHEIEKKITPRTKAVIPVHFAGQSCDMAAIAVVVRAAEKKYGHRIYLIEDACHALGSRYQDTSVGSCTFSDMTVMSFHPVKHITTGEGGAVLTNDHGLTRKLRLFRSHGITADPAEFIYADQAFSSVRRNAGAVVNPWYYEQQHLGYNYRITDIQCRLGVSQLQKLATFREVRRQVVATYNQRFAAVEHLRVPYEMPACDTNFHLYVLLFDFEGIGVGRGEAILKLREAGVQTQVHYIPVYTQPYYQQMFGTRWGECPEAEAYYAQCLSIPLFPSLTAAEVEKVVGTIQKFTRGLL